MDHRPHFLLAMGNSTSNDNNNTVVPDLERTWLLDSWEKLPDSSGPPPMPDAMGVSPPDPTINLTFTKSFGNEYTFHGVGPNMAHGFRGGAQLNPHTLEIRIQVDDLQPAPAMQFGKPYFPPAYALEFLQVLNNEVEKVTYDGGAEPPRLVLITASAAELVFRPN